MKFRAVLRTFVCCLALTSGAILPDACLNTQEQKQVYYYINDPDGNFDQQDYQVLKNAFQLWVDALGETRLVFIEEDHYSTKVDIFVNPVSQQELRESHNNLLGETFLYPYSFGGEIFIPYDSTDNWLLHIAAHEIGHALGLEHISSGNIMEKILEYPLSEITCNDAQEYCRVNDCELEDPIPACE